MWQEIGMALARLSLAAALGTALALRPKRRGTPLRTTAVVQTQIILALVGALIMLVVGASLARAFGIVGAASLIRYRSKIEDPKDAVVMLSSLSVGLAAGVGLYALATVSTAVLVIALWIIESLEPLPTKVFALTIKTGDQPADAIRPKIEAILRQHRIKWELHTLSEDELRFDVNVRVGAKPDPILEAISNIDSKTPIKVEIEEKKKPKAQ
jgi:uncharacterized membrane protein YhiD involved in acid resistance